MSPQSIRRRLLAASRAWAAGASEAFSARLVAIAAWAWMLATSAAMACDPPVGRLVSAQGAIDFRQGDAAQWQTAAQDLRLCFGDSLRVRRNSRAAIQFANGAVIRLDQETDLFLAPSADEPGPVVRLQRGRIYILTRAPRTSPRVRTRFLNASVEGTEFLVSVTPADTSVSVYEGVVSVSNASGEDRLLPGDEATATEASPPLKRLMLRPADAVEWALHVPELIGTRPPAAIAGAPAAEDWQAAALLGRRGRVTEALQRLDQAAAEAQPWLQGLRAQLLLSVGRVPEARQVIESASDITPALAHALRSLLSLLKDDKASARREALMALRADPDAAAGRLALSYVDQAELRLSDALDAAAAALRIDPGSPLVLARIAELQTALGMLDDAVANAGAAIALDADLSRSHTVLGFVDLARDRPGPAASAFRRAVALDQADPLPRMGLGLALVRSGDTREGREQLEIAASLDPTRSIIRSYLGKAYFEEQRRPLAARQFSLAKTLDPRDPTPHLYDAILLYSQNRREEALAELLTAVDLNDNRAVYRSRLYLDQDRATRQAGVASLVSQLAGERAAAALASDSLAEDPGNAAAHHFLSNSYAQRERHEIARASELLQWQLLRPLGAYLVSPEISYSDLLLLPALSDPGFFSADPASMLERDRFTLGATGVGGSQYTRAMSLVATGMQGQWAASMGLFGYRTRGFRPNSDVSHALRNAVLTWAPTADLLLQADLKSRTSRFGDVSMGFDPDNYVAGLRNAVDQTSSRLGIAFRPTTGSTLLWTSAAPELKVRADLAAPDSPDIRLGITQHARSHEAQLQIQADRVSLVAGLGTAKTPSDELLQFDWSALAGTPCPAGTEPCQTRLRHVARHRNAYVYGTYRGWMDWTWTFGLAHDAFDDLDVRLHVWSPKAGLTMPLSRESSLRLAAFRSLKRPMVANQTLEPTQVSGFSQFRDDTNGSIGSFLVGALDYIAVDHLIAGIELGQQRASVATGRQGPNLEPSPDQHLRTRWLNADATVFFGRRLSLRGALRVDQFDWPVQTIPTNAPTMVRTIALPLGVRFDGRSGWSSEMVANFVGQSTVEGLAAAGQRRESRFMTLDATFGTRLSRPHLELSLHFKNILGRRFNYRDNYFRASDVTAPEYIPVREMLVRFSITY